MMTPRVSTLALMLALAFAPHTVCAAAGEDTGARPPEAAVPGAGASRWGPIAPPDSTNRAVIVPPGAPAWRTVVNTPYWIATFPLKVVAVGAERTVAWASESSTLRRLGGLFPIRIGPMELSAGVSAGGGEGWGGSLSLDAERVLSAEHLRFRAAGQSRGQGKATLGLAWPRSAHGRAGAELGAGYRSDRNARFYGLGPRSAKARKSYWHEEMTWVGATGCRALGAGFAVEAGVLWSAVSATASGRSEEPRITSEFADELAAGTLDGRDLVGYRDLSQGTELSFELAHDGTSRDGRIDRGRPERGGTRRGKVAWFRGTDGSGTEAWTWRAEMQQFLPLWHTERALALRLVGSWIDDVGSAPMPFPRLLTNDDPDLFRGFPDDRFRDLGLFGMTAEYRWPLWSLKDRQGLGVDGFVFGDFGQVFGEPDDVALSDLERSWGFGLRGAAYGMFLGRLEWGKSDEGWVVRLSADQIFQYARGGLLHGREPVPAR